MQTVRAGRSRAAMQTVWTQTCKWAAAAHWRSCHTVLILLGSNTSCVHHKKGCRAYCRETMQTFPRCKFRNVDLHRKKRSGYCIRRERSKPSTHSSGFWESTAGFSRLLCSFTRDQQHFAQDGRSHVKKTRLFLQQCMLTNQRNVVNIYVESKWFSIKRTILYY